MGFMILLRHSLRGFLLRVTIDCKWAALVGKLNTYARAMPKPKSSVRRYGYGLGLHPR